MPKLSSFSYNLGGGAGNGSAAVGRPPFRAHEPPKLEFTPIERTSDAVSSQTLIPGLSSTYIQTVPENSKYKTKIYLPRSTGINYVGLLIGPKGIYQKKLEE